MKIKLSKLKKLIREASVDTFEIYNNLTGEIIDTLTKADASKMASLGNKQISGNEIFLDEDEFELVQDELERNRLVTTSTDPASEEALDNIKKMAYDAGYDWATDNAGAGGDAADIASDLVDGFSWEDDYEQALEAVTDELTDMDLADEDPREALNMMLKDEVVSGADAWRQKAYK